MVTATCGHVLTQKEGLGITISVKDYSREGSKAISYPTLCDKCILEYKSNDLVLDSKEKENEWLGISMDIDWDIAYEEFRTYCTQNPIDFEAFEFKRFLKKGFKISRI